jgi:CobQ-like glutamine amidotransferase family enzyme
MKLALSSLKEKRDELAEYIENEKFLLLTGNSFEMLGEKITSFLGEFEGLGIFPFTVTEQNKTRTTDDSVVNFPEADITLVGFINKCSEIEGITTPMFNVEMGLSNGKNQKTEGIRYKNLFGTHLTGPLFVKNPIFLKYIAEKLTGTELVDYVFSFERKGYEITLKKLRERNGK